MQWTQEQLPIIRSNAEKLLIHAFASTYSSAFAKAVLSRHSV